MDKPSYMSEQGLKEPPEMRLLRALAATGNGFFTGRAVGGLATGQPVAPMAAAPDAAGTPLREGLMKSMMQPAKGYADGGVVMPDMGDIPIPGSSFDVGPSGSTTYKTAGQIPPPPMMAAAAPPMAAPMAAVPRGTPAPAPGPIAPSPLMPTMQDVLKQAQGAGNQLYGQYSPDRRNDLYAALLQARNGMPNAIGSGLASVGDAIARGYGHSNSDFLDKTLQGQQEATKEGLGAFDEGQKATLAATSAGMELQKMDPGSAISKISREAYAPLLQKLGYSPASLTKMSGSNIEAVAKVAADYGGKEMENLFRQAQLIVENANQRAQIGIRQNEIKAGALKQLGEHPVASMLPTAANAALRQEAGLGGGAGAQQAGPYGADVTKDGKTYEWSPVTQKYHPK